MSLDSNGDISGFPGFSRILALMVCMGVYALLAQVLLLREFLVVFFGNELTIGAVFSAWLVLIGAGSLLATSLVARWPEERLRVLLVVLLTLAAFLLPLQVWVIRIVRTALHVAYGEYAPFFSILASLAVILAPGCLIIGIVFPCACRLAARQLPARQLPFAVSRVYAVESLGSMAAGVAFSFWLVWVMSPLAVAALAGAIVLLGAAWLTTTRTCRWLLGLIAFAFAVSACCPAYLAPPWSSLGRLEHASVEARWRSFGALPVSGSSSASRLLASCDSRYQNLALIETEGQMTLYANGQVMAVFPDAVTGEHKIHFIMAQKPDARRVLLIGGNPINDIPELLKYPLEQLVYVELDEKIGRLLELVATSAYRQALRDPRLVQVHVDAPRYAKQYGRNLDELGVRRNSSLVFSGLVGEVMRRAFRSIFSGDFGASAGFPRLRGYISSAVRGAPPSAPNLPKKIESRQEVGAEMHVADAIAPADPARYPPYNKGGNGFSAIGTNTPVTDSLRGGGTPLFDAILVDASEPATIALNRFYTQDFYRDIRSILSPGGFLYTAVSASADLQGEAAFLSASIAKTIRTVFDRVLVTSGTKNQFFAGATNSSITLERATLFRRSAGADLKTRYFRPEYFLNADEINPAKLDFVERRLAAIPVTANTVLKPVSTFYQIALWSRFSESGLESLLARLARLRLEWVAGALLGFGVVCLGMGAVLGRRPACACLRRSASRRQAKASTVADPGSAARLSSPKSGGYAEARASVFAKASPDTLADKLAGRRSGVVFSRSMLVLVMAATGLCGMALELILIFVFQALLGYVYSKVGLIVAMFMLGLMLGATVCVPTLKRSGQWRAMISMEILLIVEAACIPWLVTALSSGLMNWIPWGWVEALIYGVIAGSGALVGAQFALVNELMSHRGCKANYAAENLQSTISADAGPMPVDPAKVKGGTAAITNAADLVGAALGGLVVGVFLLPLFGITATCFLLAALKMSSLLCLLAARAFCAVEPYDKRGEKQCDK
ncbi:MAG: hypothetical protein KKC28_01455 [Verrucomicrobia bacterium]|nr:hypothetical protein [Verrucomicrobiota bacterium]MBU1855632.1 hypothetical protein [Verrucomicrobiota bacterium]